MYSLRGERGEGTGGIFNSNSTFSSWGAIERGRERKNWEDYKA
jgi:hypothetical protein